MNILTDELPLSVNVNGAEYPINYGFRAMIMIENCMFDKELNSEQSALTSLQIFYKENVPSDLNAAIDQFLWFYKCGKQQDKYNGSDISNKRVYSFEQDADYIYSAFKTQYNVDLYDLYSDDLHWWKFRAMFLSLDSNLKISEIMGYRVADTKGMTKEQKSFYKNMKKLYALKDEASVGTKMKLETRNKNMLDYINKRYQEAEHEKG